MKNIQHPLAIIKMNSQVNNYINSKIMRDFRTKVMKVNRKHNHKSNNNRNYKDSKHNLTLFIKNWKNYTRLLRTLNSQLNYLLRI